VKSPSFGEYTDQRMPVYSTNSIKSEFQLPYKGFYGLSLVHRAGGLFVLSLGS